MTSASLLTRLRRSLDDPEVGGLWRAFLETLAFCVNVYRKYKEDRCIQMASALTFTALLAIVPVLAVSFSIFKGFGAFESIKGDMQAFLLKHTIPDSSLISTLSSYFEEFTHNTYGLTFVSVVCLVVTSVSLFITIEEALGQIWNDRRRRSFFQNLTTFTSILVWGPVLLGFSTYLSLTLAASSSQMKEILGSQTWNFLFPLAASWIMFYLAFTLLPGARVMTRPALLGAGIAAVLWELGKFGFGLYVSRAVFYSKVYGSLGAIAVFLLWIYISWLVFLLGAEVTYCHQYREWLRVKGASTAPDYTFLALISLSGLLLIARRYRDGDPPTTVVELARALGQTPDIVERSLRPLKRRGILLPVAGTAHVFALSRSPETISVLDVFRALYPRIARPWRRGEEPMGLQSVSQVLHRMAEVEEQTLAEMTVKSLLEQQDSIERSLPEPVDLSSRVSREDAQSAI